MKLQKYFSNRRVFRAEISELNKKTVKTAHRQICTETVIIFSWQGINIFADFNRVNKEFKVPIAREFNHYLKKRF